MLETYYSTVELLIKNKEIIPQKKTHGLLYFQLKYQSSDICTMKSSHLYLIISL